MLIATGAGAGSRRAIGTAVFSGMCVATFLGIFLIPALYFIFQNISEKGRARRLARQQHNTLGTASSETQTKESR